MTTTGEVVVLANCVSDNGDLSSEMAYYSDAPPDASPGDVANVPTPSNQTAVWTCAINTGEFTDTHVIFVATIGPNVTEGGYAGTGNNGYTAQNGGFRCWQKATANLYTYQGRTCSGVYNCDHSAAPASSTIASCTTPTASTSSSSSATAGATTDGGLATGAVIGIGVGGGIAGIIAIVAAFLIWWHFRSNKRAAALAQRQQQQQQQAGSNPGTHDSGAGGFWGMFKKSPVSNTTTPVGAPPGDRNVAWQGPGPPPIHELEERWRPLEAPHYSRPGELDGRALAELATPESQYYAFYRQGDPGESPMSAHPNRQSRIPSNVP